MGSFKKGDLEKFIPSADMARLNTIVSALQERSYVISRAIVMKAMIRLFMNRYCVDGKWSELADPDAAVREILDISRDS